MQLSVYPRETLSLDGTWQAIPDQYENFHAPFEDFIPDDEEQDEDSPAGPTAYSIYEPESTESDLMDFNIRDGYSVPVPSSWGEEIPEFRHYEGWVWFAKAFDWEGAETGERTFLRFGAVNYKTKVWLNGEEIGSHEGGFTPFSFEITDELQDGENTLVVQVDNKRYEDGIPTKETDWFNFGGINRPVELVTVPSSFIRNFKVESTLTEDSVEVNISAWIDGDEDDTDVSAAFPELDRKIELSRDGEKHTGELSIQKNDVTLWAPETPRLYTVRLETPSDTLEDEVGFREISVEGSDILLNGEPIWLRGISLHEEAAGKGRALGIEDVETRFEWITELGCNFARLAHYPHTEEMARMADEEGILLWEEVPAYWHVNFGDDEVQELYRQQLRELIQRDWNRPSVALWSIANETDSSVDSRNEVLPEMVRYVRDLDGTRLVTAACLMGEGEQGIEINDPLEKHLDAIGLNEYMGWYTGDAEMMEHFQDDPDGPPIIISETGGGAKWGYHGDTDQRWTEEYQADIYRGQTEAIAGNGQIAGLSPWILFDFRAPMRQNEYQRGYNRKGLLDPHGRKKNAFHTLQEFYQSLGQN